MLETKQWNWIHHPSHEDVVNNNLNLIQNTVFNFLPSVYCHLVGTHLHCYMPKYDDISPLKFRATITARRCTKVGKTVSPFPHRIEMQNGTAVAMISVRWKTFTNVVHRTAYSVINIMTEPLSRRLVNGNNMSQNSWSGECFSSTCTSPHTGSSYHNLIHYSISDGLLERLLVVT